MAYELADTAHKDTLGTRLPRILKYLMRQPRCGRLLSSLTRQFESFMTVPF